MDVILVDFSQEIVWPEATKSDPIDYNGEQNLVVCHTHQHLVKLLQGDQAILRTVLELSKLDLVYIKF